ncbi:chromate transporter, partial [Lachnospiraceae bacterium OttesenSCG-928-E19]|nr:chromate transporter [Lachnospiraceae bacterium OttesenSCG-928-E19]
FLENFSESPIVKAVFYGVRPTVAALIGYAVFELIKITLFTATTSGYQPDYTGILLCAIIFFLLQWKVLEKLHPIIWMIGGACVGVILKL